MKLGSTPLSSFKLNKYITIFADFKVFKDIALNLSAPAVSQKISLYLFLLFSNEISALSKPIAPNPPPLNSYFYNHP